MFYLVNKPKGITSFFALKKIRARLGIDKIGHTGTLDPLASGLLIVATENSTKLISYLEKATKTYRFTMRMDGWTESGDLEKEVIFLDNELVRTKKSTITTETFKNILQEKFTGKLTQIPSKFSAIKVDGKAAYLSARKGKEVIIPERDFEIFDIQLIDFSFPDVTLEVTVSAGTYIRTLASDIAKSLGLDAYLTSLIRTSINKLTLDQSYDIETLEKSETIEYATLFPDYPIIDVAESHPEFISGSHPSLPEDAETSSAGQIDLLSLPSFVATRLLNGLTQENNFGLKNGIYFLRVAGVFRALILAKDEILMIERNNISEIN